jgi:hypothetical protein
MGKDDEDDTKGKKGGGLTDEQREEIGRIVNAGVTAQLARKLPEAITQGVQPILDRLDKIGGGKPGKGSQQAGAGEDDEDDGDSDGAPPKGKKGGKAKELDPDVATMKARLKAIEDERAKEREDNLISKRDSEIKDLLTTGKVDPMRLKGAVAVVAGNLKRQKDGTFTYTAQREGYVDDLPIADGVAEWLKSDEGKAYVVAQQRPGGAGTSARVGQQGTVTRGAPQKDAGQQKADRKMQAMETLQSQIGSMLDNGGAE